MKIIIITTLISLSVINCEQDISSNSLNEEVSINETEVTNIIEYLASDELNGRDTGSDGIEKAAVFIEDRLKKNGVAPYFETYRDSFSARGIFTHNIVGFLKGTDETLENQFVIIGAHYDHIGSAIEVSGDTIANGANDNAAGVTAVISLSKHFATIKRNKRSILFVLFGAEEKGLLGSEHLSKKLKKSGIDIYTMLNFEMIGVPMINKPYKTYITGHNLSNMANKINEYGISNLVGFLPKAEEEDLFLRSDNYPFYQRFRVPCQTISSFDFTNYDYYHHVDDEASEMNYRFITEIINNYIPVINRMANSQEKEILLN